MSRALIAADPRYCAHEGCNMPRSGKSKYCADCKLIARSKFKLMLADKKEEREAQDAEFARLFDEAHVAAQASADALTPRPMLIQGYRPVMDGVCGFAWVSFRPGNSKLAHYAKKNHDATKAYGGGLQMWIHGFGQSYEKKMAYAQGFTGVFQHAGHGGVTAGGRLD
jgi:hypothetical protein